MRFFAHAVTAGFVLTLSACPGSLKDQLRVDGAVRDLRGGSPVAKTLAIAILVEADSRSPQVIEALQHATADSVAEIRARALQALAELRVGSETMRALIRRALEDRNFSVRYTAMDLLTLDRYRDPATLGFLLQTLRDSSPGLRATAAVAIGVLGRDAESALGQLEVAARDTNEVVRHEARDAMSAITKTKPNHRP